MPINSKTPQGEVETLLAGYDPEVRSLVNQLRKFIHQLVPDANEAVKLGWQSFSYRHPQQGYFCGIFPGKDSAKLVFEFGILLSDPDKLLQGDGSQVRFVNLVAGEAIPFASIQRLVQNALDLPEKRADKLALVQSKARPVDQG